MIKRTKKTLAVFGLIAWALLAPRLAAGAPAVRITGPETLQLLDPTGQPQTSWTVEATIQDTLQIDNTLYVACGPRGVLIFDLAAPDKPALLGRIAEGRNVVKLAQNGQSLLVVVADFSALNFSLADPQKPLLAPLTPPSGGVLAVPGGAPTAGSATGAASPADSAEPAYAGAYRKRPPRAPRTSWAQVTTVRGGWVAVTTSAPAQVGDRFLVHSQRRVRVSDPTLAQKLYAPSDEPMGMFLVRQVRGSVASGPLPRGTIAHVGDLAEPTAEPLRAPKVAPQLWYGMGRFYATLRPIIGVASTSSQFAAAPFGMLNDFTLEYYFRVPLKLGVQVAPLGMVFGSRAGLTSEIRALISFASSYFELGLEAGGGLSLVDKPQVLVGYMLRLGSLDGLNLIFHNSYTVDGRSTNAPLAFGSFNAEINIPLASRFNLFLNSGGAPRWAYAILGLKYYIRGGGGPGTLIVSSGAGGAWVNDRCDYNPNSTNASYCQSSSIEAFGPALSLGLDARF